MTRCQYRDCLRAPAYPNMAYCARHQLRWIPRQPVDRIPEWRKRLTAKELRDAA